ncbi:dihydrolipoyl dehydrogenase family protein [Actinomyces vulturis]|uniref:dihydrolipoyl dehydrogenase family protein n=1 Tax=Actinomyces vulturis TaxID=1857645 RepID=UPI000830FA66|nr:FAD-dependent oxidoreductase [Actinomyces vulturis]
MAAENHTCACGCKSTEDTDATAGLQADLSTVEDVDLLVVGGGKAGKSLAMLRAKKGDRVVMVERDKVGGTCINVACIPTKTLVTSARVLETVRKSASYGASLPGGSDELSKAVVSLEALRARKEKIVGAMVGAHEKMFPASGMDFVKGTATFVAPKTVSIALNDGGTRVIRGAKVLINTGTTPAVPPIDGLKDVDFWTSEDLLRLTELPKDMVILGGGVIGVEMASMMSSFGVSITLVDGGEHILAREDADAADVIRESLEAQGVTVLNDFRAASVSSDNGTITVKADDGREVAGERLLVALGRTPVTKNLNLEAAGVELTDRGFVKVDDRLQTTAEGVYSAGDVAGSPQFTHVSWNDFRVLRDLFDGKDASTKDRLIPWTVFVTPELGRVGMSETEAREAGKNIRVAKVPTANVPRAKTLGETDGFFKIVVDADTDKILGATIIGSEAGEVITSVQMAMLGGLTWQQVRDAVIAHPTMSEGLNIVLDAMPAK